MICVRNLLLVFMLLLQGISASSISDAPHYVSGQTIEENVARYPGLVRLADEFGCDTVFQARVLPEDDELWRVARFATHVGTGLYERYVSTRGTAPESAATLLEKALPWLCLGDALYSREARGVLFGLSELHGTPFEEGLLGDLKEGTRAISRKTYGKDRVPGSRDISYRISERPPMMHKLDRRWDLVSRLLGRSVLPSAEDRIMARIRDLKEFHARLALRRVSDETTLSAASAHGADYQSDDDDEGATAADTALLLGDGHLKED